MASNEQANNNSDTNKTAEDLANAADYPDLMETSAAAGDSPADDSAASSVAAGTTGAGSGAGDAGDSSASVAGSSAGDSAAASVSPAVSGIAGATGAGAGVLEQTHPMADQPVVPVVTTGAASDNADSVGTASTAGATSDDADSVGTAAAAGAGSDDANSAGKILIEELIGKTTATVAASAPASESASSAPASAFLSQPFEKISLEESVVIQNQRNSLEYYRRFMERKRADLNLARFASVKNLISKFENQIQIIDDGATAAGKPGAGDAGNAGSVGNAGNDENIPLINFDDEEQEDEEEEEKEDEQEQDQSEFQKLRAKFENP